MKLSSKILLGLVVVMTIQIPGAVAALGTYPAIESVAVGGGQSGEYGSSRIKLYLAGLAGGGLLDEQRGLRITYGARAGLLLNSKISIGGYFNRLPVASNTIGTVNMNTFMGELTYSPYGLNQGWFIGGRAGTTFTIVNSNGVSTTNSGLGFMPVLGFEDAMDEHLLWGLEASYLLSTNDIAPQGLSLLGSLKLLLF
ncbi:MAG: hypothetical protein KA715_05035 [Xanthomonadaceae bacterium]|nr:hypothetical protein [Xanthomonadaceae bacterium]